MILGQQIMPRGLFITGTDTGAGKTWLCSQIIRSANEDGIRTGGYKPVCSGVSVDSAGQEVWEDIEALRTACCREVSLELICPQAFRAALAPPVAAREEGKTVDRQLLSNGVNAWSGRVDFLVVEGVGGFLCPIAESYLVADLAQLLGYPIVIVSANRLGVINHTLLTYESVRARDLNIATIVLNNVAQETHDSSRRTNLAEIEALVECPVLEMGYGQERAVARGKPLSGLDWFEFADHGRKQRHN